VEEIATGELTEAQLTDEIIEVVRVLEQLGAAEVRVEHCAGHGHVTLPEASQLFSAWTEVTGKLQDYRPGRGHVDFDIYEDSHGLHFQFCHHDELHVRCENQELQDRF
jgi:hypothetical protein